MMKVFCESLLVALRGELDGVSFDNVRPKAVLREQASLVAGAMSRLSDFRSSHVFEGMEQQIWFHKSVFPEFFALGEYARLKYELMSGMPVEAGKVLRKYYSAWLKRFADFFSVYGFYYDYYSGDSLLLDEVLYTSADQFNVLQPVLAGVDWSAGTAMGHLLGMFKAYERLRDELLQLSYGLQAGKPRSASTVGASGELNLSGEMGRFRWKGEAINLIELGHGIYLTGQIEAEVGIVEFFKALGDFFGVNLRVPKRGFDDLKKRKTISRTHFCELMSKALVKKMEDEDAYDPGKQARRNGFF